jgi:hypothetical protein
MLRRSRFSSIMIAFALCLTFATRAAAEGPVPDVLTETGESTATVSEQVDTAQPAAGNMSIWVSTVAPLLTTLPPDVPWVVEQLWMPIPVGDIAVDIGTTPIFSGDPTDGSDWDTRSGVAEGPLPICGTPLLSDD